MHYEAVLFDMDGVIFDTESITYKAFLSFCSLNNLKTSFDIYALLLGTNSNEGHRRMYEVYGDRFNFEEFLDYAKTYRNNYIRNYGLKIKKGFLQLNSYLERHHIKKALVTSTNREVVDNYIETSLLNNVFDLIVTGDEVERSKPSPDIYLYAASKLEVMPHLCLVVEDSKNGILSGSNAHMDVICIPDMVQHPQEINDLCLAVLPTLDQIIQYL